MINKGNKIVLENCLYVPSFGYNLISVSKLDQLGYELRIKSNQAHIYKNDKLLLTAICKNSLYYINIVNNNNLPSEETKKVKQKETKKVEQKETKKVKQNKQINKIELTNKINLLEQRKL